MQTILRTLLGTRTARRLLAMAIASLVMVSFGASLSAQDTGEVPAEEISLTLEAVAESVAAVQVNLDATWVIVASILVFFMQTGFALLEAGMIRQTGVVNSLMENFMDAALGGLIFWLSASASPSGRRRAASSAPAISS